MKATTRYPQADDGAVLSADHSQVAVDATPALIHTALPDGSVDFLNRGWLDFVGLPIEDLLGWGWLKTFHPDDVDSCVAKWRAALASGEAFEGEGRVRRADGEYRLLLHRKVPVRGETGFIVKWYGSSTDIEDRRRAELRLRETDERFRRMADAMPEVFWFTALRPERVLYASPSFERIWGLPVSSLYDNPRRWTETIHPDDRDRVSERFERWINGHESTYTDVEYRILRPDGDVRWIHEDGVLSRDAHGQPNQVSGISMDITERKRAEQKLRRSEAYLVEAQGLSRTGSFGWNVAANEIIWSNETFRIFDYDSQITPTIEHVLRRVHPDDHDRVRVTLERLSEAPQDFDVEHRLLMPDGTVKYLSVVAHVVREFGDVDLVGAVMDVTDRELSARALKAAFDDVQAVKDQFRLALDTIPGLVWSALPDGYIDYLNQRWLEYTGMNFEEAKGWGWQVSIHPEDLSRLLDIWRGLLQDPQPGTAKTRLRRYDGQYRWFLFRAVPLHDETGTLVKWYGQTTDIDDLQRAEEELRRSEEFRLEERVNERTRIARELHDTLLQSFQGLVLRFQTASTLLPIDASKAQQALTVALERADQAIAEGREAVLGLRTSSGDIDSDFARALTALGDDFVTYSSQDDSQPAAFRVLTEGTPRALQSIVHDELYQIAREALRNAFRHADAGRVEAHLCYGETQFLMRIVDDGVGIEPSLVKGEGHPGHWGLLGMRERAMRIRADIDISARRERGTEVAVGLTASLAYDPAGTAAP